MIVVPIMRHSAESQDLVDSVQCRIFRMIIGNAAVAALLRWFLRIWWIVLLNSALPSMRNSLITHSLSICIAGIRVIKRMQANGRIVWRLNLRHQTISRNLMMLKGITSGIDN